jgi:hypothetical protein
LLLMLLILMLMLMLLPQRHCLCPLQMAAVGWKHA